jgi:hypothetical protein
MSFHSCFTIPRGNALVAASKQSTRRIQPSFRSNASAQLMDSASDNENSIDILELDSERIAAYNASMKERMHNPYEYHPEKGKEYNHWG